MNILFLTLMKIRSVSQTGIYPDLINEFAEHGHDMYVVTPHEKSEEEAYNLITEQKNIHFISAYIPDYFGMGLIKKGISSIVMGKCYLKAIKAAIPNVKFDIIMYSTPPITFCDVIKMIKKRDNACTYLLLKDIWPQGLVDIGVLSSSGLKGMITKYYRKKEKRLYDISDFIGCMSDMNCQYLIKNYGISEKKVEVCPNSIKVNCHSGADRIKVRSKYELPLDKVIYIYGGNLGLAQGIPFIISCLKENEKSKHSFILIVGSGTEYSKLEKWFKENQPQNSKLISYIPQEEYKEVLSVCDVGLIFLDHRFTIPNIPSRLLSYLEAKKPVIAAIDNNTDLGRIIQTGGFGYSCESKRVESFIGLLEIMNNRTVREELGLRGYNYLLEHYTTKDSYKIIIKHMDGTLE